MKISELLFPPPFKARHRKRTYVASPEDEAGTPAREVIEFALEVVRRTLDTDIALALDRARGLAWRPECWPGEHYRLLAGVVAHLQPRTVIEIGTDKGISALSLLQHLPADGRVVTFDLIPWDRIPNTCLRPDDFRDGRLRQELADLSRPEAFTSFAPLLASAELLFVDGPKDRVFEPAFAERLDTLTFATPPWVIFDDIRDLNMLCFWRGLNKPKLDLSSFGHWTGTGLVQWRNP